MNEEMNIILITKDYLKELVSYKEDYDKLLEENRIIKEGNEALSEEIQETKNAYYQLHKSAIKEVTKLREKRDKLSQEIVDINIKEHEIKISGMLKENRLIIENDTLKKDIGTLKNIIQELINENEELVEENEKLTNETEKHKLAVVKVNEKISDIENMCTSDIMKKKNSALIKSREEAESRCTELEEKCDSYCDEISGLKEKNMLLENKMKSLKEEYFEMSDAIEATAKTIHSLKEKNALLESELINAEYKLKNMINIVLSENESLIKENESLKFSVDLLKS
jgi:chromosome segregation ATPase